MDFADGLIPLRIWILGLVDGEALSLDLSPYLPVSAKDITVNITPLGKSDGTALFVFAPPHISVTVQ